MAGAPAGGAELFFERLTIALAASGETVLPVIRRNPARAARLAAAGLAPVELPFGGPLDLLTGRTPAPRAAPLRAARHGRLDEPRRALHAARRLGAGRPARRLLRPALLPPLRPPGRQHARHRRLDRRARAGPPRGCTTCRTSRRTWRTPSRRHSACRTGPRSCLALGRLHRNKGFDVLIRALPALPGRACGDRRRGAGTRGSARTGRTAKASPTGCICSAGAAIPPRCSPPPTCWSARPATSRWATW